MTRDEESLHTTQLNLWLVRIRAGDLSARDELLRSVCGQLERLARSMLRRFPNVGAWTETGDVLSGALMRLLRALEKLQPDSTREFFGLAAQQIRRELLDLARHFGGPLGHGANLARLPIGEAASGIDPPDQRSCREEMERWTAFHEAVDHLPAEEREVMGLIYYHGWSQAEVAELFTVSTKTVQRRWDSALLKLRDKLRDLGGTA
jgi:RNA polymerase sigma-70 factor (ECF subfamily)